MVATGAGAGVTRAAPPSQARAALCLLATVLAVGLSGACSGAAGKNAALDRDLLASGALPGDRIQAGAAGENTVVAGPAWMADVDPAAHATFVSYRFPDAPPRYARVRELEVAEDRLRLELLEPDETPLGVLDRAASGEEERIDVSLSDAIRSRRLGPPLPAPAHLFAVAANLPSHLIHDLAFTEARARRRELAASRARVFIKYPPVPAPGAADAKPSSSFAFLGPFDGLAAPARIAVPPANEGVESALVPTRFDYEVEVGLVIGRTLTRKSAASASDEELRRAVAGYVLVSDAKARNPQVMGKLLTRGQPIPDDHPYGFESPDLDATVGVWNERTCQWWSHAASWGSYAAVGPFFVAAPPGEALPGRAIAAARSYGPRPPRPHPAPPGTRPSSLYLRQLSKATEDERHPDAMIWSVPQILRSILAPRNALAFLGDIRLERGDIVALGTPGGVVLTAPSRTIATLGRTALFWRGPRDWHDAFFEPDAGRYLNPGDELLLWAEGLGLQHHTIQEGEP